MALYKPPSSFEKEEGCLSGDLLIMILGAVITGLCVVGGYVVLRRRRPENTVPVTRRLEELTKAVQQLQALMHVENSLTREAMHDEFAREFKDFGARVQAVMNKVMQVSETVLLFSDRLDVLESELKKALAEFKTAVVDATTKMGTRLSSFHTDTLKSLKDYVEELKAELRSTAKTLGDRVKEDTGGAVMDCQKTLQHMLMPMKSAQDKHAATWNDKFTEVMKELANTPYRLSKESKDIQAQVRWCQQTADKIQQATEHLPDRLGLSARYAGTGGRRSGERSANKSPPPTRRSKKARRKARVTSRLRGPRRPRHGPREGRLDPWGPQRCSILMSRSLYSPWDDLAP